ncbi:MAG: LptF/LptG family permease [Melioribacteraceae bacterium]|nr:LptF/LptG family permease [Melioribacteraceae bacterium]
MILIRYILRNHLVPFLFANFTLIAVLLLQYLMKMADKLIGKGLSTMVILQLVMYSLAWMIVLVVPMSVLISTIMAFGNMSQNNEVAIMKATGVSLYKMMIPPLLGSILIAWGLVYFNNNIYPDSNHAARLLLEDIARKKPTLSLAPGVFSKDIPNYSILTREIDQLTNELKSVTIYDYSNPPKINIVTAQKGKIYFSKDQKKLIMDLETGEIHETSNINKSEYRRLRFDRHKIAMPADEFTFEQSAPGGQRGDRELGANAMLTIVDSLANLNKLELKDFTNKLTRMITKAKSEVIEANPTNVSVKIEQQIRFDESSIKSISSRLDYLRKEKNRYWVEIHKKYALPFACLVFVLIGAPLGTMSRKGGFGMAAGLSLFFFLIYWVFLIGGEKLADRGLLSPFVGIWGANIFLGLIGVLLMIKSAKEMVTINFEFFNKLIPKSWRNTEVADENY